MNIFSVPELAARAVANHPARPAMMLAHDSADARLLVFRIEPGQAVPIHTNLSAVTLIVVAGRGIVSGAQDDRVVGVGDIVTYDRGEPHGMRAADEVFVLAALISPSPSSH